MITVNYIASIILIVLGLYTVCVKKNLIKIVLGLGIIDYGVNLLIVSIGWNDAGTAPIYTMSDLLNGVAKRFFVDPVPQALTLTSIVIGACVTAMAISLVIMIYRKYRTLDANEIRRIRG
ncbi:MAG: NADH-quinone oxidoreductase subunit K [Oscillospiraceae bacterium]|nr:NADH-quinone oxidoreductase subunit K [Oscillospiraceae bacterium]